MHVFDYLTSENKRNCYLLLLLLLIFMGGIGGLVYLLVYGKVQGTLNQGCVAGVVLLSIALISQFGTFKRVHKRLREEQIVVSKAGIEFKTDDLKVQSNWRDLTGLQIVKKPLSNTNYIVYLKGGGTIEFTANIRERDVLIRGIENNTGMAFREGPGVEATAKEKGSSGSNTTEIKGKNAAGMAKMLKQKDHKIDFDN
ncbi:MAG: hypothetical protein AB9903_31725 [Vulcanimicrobiota bacterium]